MTGGSWQLYRWHESRPHAGVVTERRLEVELRRLERESELLRREWGLQLRHLERQIDQMREGLGDGKKRDDGG